MDVNLNKATGRGVRYLMICPETKHFLSGSCNSLTPIRDGAWVGSSVQYSNMIKQFPWTKKLQRVERGSPHAPE